MYHCRFSHFSTVQHHHSQQALAVLGALQQYRSVFQERIRAESERPCGTAVIFFFGKNRCDFPARPLRNIPPTRFISDKNERAVWCPLWLNNTSADSARYFLFISNQTGSRIKIGNPQFTSIPRHVWMIPRQPTDLVAGSVLAWRRIEIVTTCQHTYLTGSIRWNGDNRVVSLTIFVMRFVDRQNPT